MKEVAFIGVFKTCTQCGAEKLRGSDFYGKSAECKDCFKARQRLHWQATKNDLHRRQQQRRRSWRSQIKKNFGLTEEAYYVMLRGQNEVCAICGRPQMAMTKDRDDTKMMVVDHDHRSGEIRGLLCDDCNNLLGRAHDDPAVLEAAAAYLRRAVR